MIYKFSKLNRQNILSRKAENREQIIKSVQFVVMCTAFTVLIFVSHVSYRPSRHSILLSVAKILKIVSNER